MLTKEDGDLDSELVGEEDQEEEVYYKLEKIRGKRCEYKMVLQTWDDVKGFTNFDAEKAQKYFWRNLEVTQFEDLYLGGRSGRKPVFIKTFNRGDEINTVFTTNEAAKLDLDEW